PLFLYYALNGAESAKWTRTTRQSRGRLCCISGSSRSPVDIVGAPTQVGKRSVRLEEHLRQPENPLLPRHSMRHAGARLEFRQVVQVPLVIPQQRLLIRMLGTVSEFPLRFFNRNKR